MLVLIAFYLIAFVLSTLGSGCCLWAGMKLTGLDGTFLGMLVIGAVSTLLGFIPYVGPILAIIAMFVLIYKWTDANFWPDSVLMVLVARCVAIMLWTGLLTM